MVIVFKFDTFKLKVGIIKSIVRITNRTIIKPIFKEKQYLYKTSDK